MLIFCVFLCRVYLCTIFFFFFKQKTAYEMRISDWSSDVCSSDLSSLLPATAFGTRDQVEAAAVDLVRVDRQADQRSQRRHDVHRHHRIGLFERGQPLAPAEDRHPAVVIPHRTVRRDIADARFRSEEHTSELQSLMRYSYAVFCF